MVNVVAISAIKKLTAAKSRLQSGFIPAAAKPQLVLSMLLDTFTALSSQIDQHYVISPDPLVAQFAHTHRLTAIVETENITAAQSLNVSLTTAVHIVQKNHPESYILIIQPDLPAISPVEVSQLIELIQKIPIGIIPDAQGSGTTVLSFAPGRQIPLCFGIDSALAHQHWGAEILVGNWEGIQHDIDTIEDIMYLFSSDFPGSLSATAPARVVYGTNTMLVLKYLYSSQTHQK